MEGSLSFHLPQCDIHAQYGGADVLYCKTPPSENHLSCPCFDGQEWVATPELAAQPIFKVTQLFQSF